MRGKAALLAHEVHRAPKGEGGFEIGEDLLKRLNGVLVAYFDILPKASSKPGNTLLIKPIYQIAV